MGRVLVIAFALSFYFSVNAQRNFYAADTLQKVEIFFSDPDWDHKMDTAKFGSDSYLMADSVKINGTVFWYAGVQYKGNSSFDSTRKKNPLHIELDHFVNNANYQGCTDIKMSNGYQDPSAVREVLGYEILRNYMAAPQCNFAQVYINNVYYGVFSSAESISKDFLSDHFYSSDNSFFKCNPVSVVSGQYPNLLYLGQDSANYYNRYEIKSDAAWKDLINLCDTLNNYPSKIDSILDVDRALWMLAFNNVTVNLDSYTGAFSQNYYLYRDDNNRFDPIVWDLNMCFGGFPATGSGNLNITQMQQLTPLLHSTNGARPLIKNLLSNSSYSKMYIAHMRTINNEFFNSGAYLTRAQNLQALIDTAVQSEQFSLFNYTDFQNGLTSNVSTIPGVSVLMNSRASYLNATSEFQNSPPSITNVTHGTSVVNINDTILVTCSISNASSVYLGSRDQVYKRFRRNQMFDDGMHNDGSAGDGVYGMFMIASSAIMDYYVYAENSSAGIFSPERAEYEFYKVLINVAAPAAGTIVINEFLAVNTAYGADEEGKNEDWIELYNNSNNSVPLLGLYLSDDNINLQKFALPNVVMQPHTYLIVWADEDEGNTASVHANFKLAAAGEQLFLSTASGIIIDSVSFSAQTTDISLQRCSNGTGGFAAGIPTFNYENCTVGMNEYARSKSIFVFPNPAQSVLNFRMEEGQAAKAVIYNTEGRMVKVFTIENGNSVISVDDLPNGMYFASFNSSDGNIIGSIKFSVFR